MQKPADLFDVFGSDDDSESLHVNEAFAARFDREGARKEAQRLSDMTAADPLSDVAVQVLIRCAKKAMKLVSAKLARMNRRDSMSSAEVESQINALGSKLTPAVIASEALRRANFVCTEQACAMLVPSSAHDPATLAAMDRVLRHAMMQKQLVSLATWAKKHSVLLCSTSATPANEDPIDSFSSTLKRKREKSCADEPTTRVTQGQSLTPLTNTSTSQARSVLSSPILRPDTAHSTAGESSARIVYMHGRGAGKGRGLSSAGEPSFEELHPSWQAKRRLAKRSHKIISKSIRSAGP
jgi:hypothetical protein